MQYREMQGEITEQGDNAYRWTLTSAAANRVGDETDIMGFELNDTEFPLLDHHDRREFAIGRVYDVEKTEEALVGTVEFDRGDERGAFLEGKVQRGYIKRGSIGYIELETEPLDPDNDDYYFGRWYWGPVKVLRADLLEFSLVNVPADYTATIQRVGSGADVLTARMQRAMIAHMKDEIAAASRIISGGKSNA